ncbi:MAG TPA: class I SAM-dependent methyltransferase [Bryobacteraceae bacterium]|nr:class I SAM-dependent methyltransferase [Bryobacteraceae bacterium]
MIVRLSIAALLALGGMQMWAQADRRPLSSRYQADSLAPYVPSPQMVVDKMLESAQLKPGETLFDLGCGDGRIPITAAKDFKIKGVCVEISDELVKAARDNIKRQGLGGSVSVVHGNLLQVDLKPADIVTLYLLTDSNEKLKPLLETSLKSGARVVSHDFKMRGWKPDHIDTVDVNGRTHTIFVYRMPPKKD